MIKHCFNPTCSNEAKVKFCSRSCAATYNNSIVPKRKPEHKCTVCDSPTTANKVICSAACREKKYAFHTTIGELKAKSVRSAQVYNQLRQRSRKLAIMFFKMKCWDCGWDEHVEVCHINELSALPDDTLILDATKVENFLLLCPNHHWKFDHNNDYRKMMVVKFKVPVKFDYGPSN
jgi:hypothetical protein